MEKTLLLSRHVLLATLLFVCASVQAGTLPNGFAELRLAEGLDGTTVNYAPDGRLFVTQKKGLINVIKNGVMLTTPFLDLQSIIDNRNERGLQSLVFDPNFATNGYIYVYYCVNGQSRNRVSRFTANGDVVVPNSELVLINLDVLSGSIHNGGALFFKAGKLFITTGDGGNGNNSSSFNSLLGKVLRINADGTIPADNPYYTTLAGNYRLIYALGLRNPFRASVQPGTERVFINDVGNSAFEEVNELMPGKNYGWPSIEGVRTTQTPPANYQDPFYAYSHALGCSIGGGAFYNPQNPVFPSKYIGKYFFGDYCGNYIKVLDPETGEVIETFATNVNRPISFSVGNDGSLYYLARGGLAGGSSEANSQSCCSEVWKVSFTNNGAPTISANPSDQLVSIGGSATFAVGASGDAPLTYQWQRNGVNIPGATNYIYEFTNATLADNGTVFRAVITNPLGTATSLGAVLSVTSNLPPQPVIELPTEGTVYATGTQLDFVGSATDTEDGVLPASAFTWEINFHHDTHTHPAMAPTSGITSGTYTLSPNHDPATNVWYRIYLTVRDSQGQETTVFRDIHPVLVSVTLSTNKPGLKLKIDGVEVDAPYIFEGVAGIERSIEAPTPQIVDGITYEFLNWSDGGAAEHHINTPSSNQTISAFYLPLYLEAEQALLSGATTRWTYAGFTGTGFADYDTNNGGYIEWTVNAPHAGNYRLAFRNANGSTKNRPLRLTVNGVERVASLAFLSTGLWTNWEYVESVQALNAGTNKVRLTSIGSNGPNIDYMLVYQDSAPVPTVSTPQFTPAPGTYTSSQLVTITTATSGASVYYTLDGTTPTTSSTLYSEPLTISATTTLKALAVKSGMDNSVVQTGLYTINSVSTVNTPQFTPPAGTYTDSQLVSISTTTTGATIHYTLNGTIPTVSSAVYTTPLTISSTTTLKAIAVKAGMTNSGVQTAVYTISDDNQPFTTTLEAENATLSGVSVKASGTGFTGTGFADYDGNSGTYIHWAVNVPAAGQYRLDFRYGNGSNKSRPLAIAVNGTTTEGSKPFPSTVSWDNWSIVSSTVQLNAGANTIRATSIGSGGANFDHLVVTGLASIPVVNAPVFTPAQGVYPDGVSVTLSSSTTGSTIYYTLNGSTPSASSSVYNAAIAISATTTIRAIAIKEGISSTVVSATYTIEEPGSFDDILEAEAATRQGVSIKANYAGFTGTGFGDYVGASGDYLQWNFSVPSAGLYTLQFRYALPTGNRPLQVMVNGVIVMADRAFPGTGAWTTWAVVDASVSLNAGNNTVRITDIGYSGPNVDHMRVTNLPGIASMAREASIPPAFIKGEGEDEIEVLLETEDDVNIFPIPAKDILTIRSSNDIQFVSLVHADGRTMNTRVEQASSNEILLYVNVLPDGVSIVTLRSGTRYIRKKIIIEK
ncbi:MAG TPA: chitobiase/beta-hexosaminidase C-terminal domain-containing protein [Ohtaekwangia sp.]|nr:chitobiase/beta-hexosaminidase C-terminal domain-containing protein [Ohtaekwangia sp.]